MESKAKKFIEARTNKGAAAGAVGACGQFLLKRKVEAMNMWLHSRKNRDLLNRVLENKDLQSKTKDWQTSYESLKNLETIIQVIETMKVGEAD